MEKTDNKVSSNKESKPLKTYVRYSGLAFQILAVIVIGTWIGYWVDSLVPWQVPIFTLLGALTALIMVILYLIKQTK